jgi:deoxyuridine 5'-triphosphate nucleotidohydrolase
MEISDNYFSVIDTDVKAYFLGQMAGSETVCTPNGENFILKISDEQAFAYKEMACNICKLFQVFFGESTDNIAFPKLPNARLTWLFIRGLFDQRGYISSFECGIKTGSIQVKKHIEAFSGIKCSIDKNYIIFRNTNCLDFLSRVYDNSTQVLRNAEHFTNYQKLLGVYTIPKCRFVRTVKQAVVPEKTKCSDEGYDLWLVSVDKKISENTVRYDTGIKIQPENGWHIEILPRSSLSNSGYMLSNSVGLIDSSYRGTLKIVLTKVNPNAEDIVLPFKCVQMVLRKNVHFLCEEVEELDDTSRGEGSFGSTNKA